MQQKKSSIFIEDFLTNYLTIHYSEVAITNAK